MKIKKRRTKIILAAVALYFAVLAGFIIRDAVHPPEEPQSGVDATPALSREQTAGDAGYEFAFEGSSATAENPWGFTAGMVDVENEGRLAMLQPNTSLRINGLSGGSLSLQAEIFPQVAAASDGAGLTISQMAASGAVVRSEEWILSPEEGWKPLPLALEEGVVSVLIQCDNGAADDDSADWVMLKID